MYQVLGSMCCVCMMEPYTRQLAASTGMARQVQHPGTMEPVAPGAASWALHIGTGCQVLHTRHGHEDWAQHEPGHNMCQHWHCTLALSSTRQTLHTLPQLQVHHWAYSSDLLALLDCTLLPCFCPLPVTLLCLPCPPAVQDGAVGSWVQTVPGSLSTLPPGTANQDHR